MKGETIKNSHLGSGWMISLLSDKALRLLVLLVALALLLIGLALPLLSMLIKSLQNTSGAFIGLANFSFLKGFLQNCH
ncbi:MAG: hypothetical protein IBX50_15280 [Marinospirillum sp.]|uniref:hypothetical protein n=1 Tax=Marinospirillum sp. TaxID=2183934 RepID=UPI001A05EF9B|nr:hypothetical protein [Marinospirillum sp.]MBE0508050.1 hypothetical protein [Marinospirillum sp.]